jgi:hypothetical protein
LPPPVKPFDNVGPPSLTSVAERATPLKREWAVGGVT